MANVAAGIGAHHVILTASDPDPGAGAHCWSAHVPNELLPALHAELGAMHQVAERTAAGTTFDVEALVPWELGSRMTFYQRFVRPMEGRHAAFSVPFTGGVIAACRTKTMEAFGGVDLHRLAALAPQLGAALRLKRHVAALHARAASLEHALDGLAVGVILGTRDGRILFANTVAAALLAERDPESGDAALDQRRLRAMLAAADGAPRALHRHGSSQVAVARAVPLSAAVRDRAWPVRRASVALFLRVPRQTEGNANSIAELLGLTPREASLAELLARGLDLRAAAAALGIAESSARTYLKRIFVKTDTRRQAELVRLVLRCLD